MPIFDYMCNSCLISEERNIKIENRDYQICECGELLKRQITFVGAVFAPTSTNGGMKR